MYEVVDCPKLFNLIHLKQNKTRIIDINILNSNFVN